MWLVGSRHMFGSSERPQPRALPFTPSDLMRGLKHKTPKVAVKRVQLSGDTKPSVIVIQASLQVGRHSWDQWCRLA